MVVIVYSTIAVVQEQEPEQRKLFGRGSNCFVEFIIWQRLIPFTFLFDDEELRTDERKRALAE